MVDASLCAPLLAELRGNAKAELREAVIAAVLDAVPRLRVLPHEDVAAAVVLIVGALIKAVADEPLSSTDQVMLRDAGQRWAAVGLDSASLATVIATAAQAALAFLSQLADRARYQRKRDRRPAVEQVGSALIEMVSSVQQAFLAGIASDAGRRAGGEQTLVDRILDEVPDAWAGMEEEAIAAGFGSGAGLVIVLPGPAVTHTNLVDLGDRLAEQHRGARGSVQPDPIPHLAVLVKDTDAARWHVAVKHVELDVAAAGCELVAARCPVPLMQLPLAYKLSRAVHWTTPAATAAGQGQCAFGVVGRAPFGAGGSIVAAYHGPQTPGGVAQQCSYRASDDSQQYYVSTPNPWDIKVTDRNNRTRIAVSSSLGPIVHSSQYGVGPVTVGNFPMLPGERVTVTIYTMCASGQCAAVGGITIRD